MKRNIWYPAELKLKMMAQQHFSYCRCLMLLISCCFFSITVAQNQKFTLISTISTTGNFFTTDKLGNTYIIEQSEIKKYNENGALQCSYNYKDLGMINYLDATDPFKVMLFQPEFLKIRTLDTRLNVIGEIDLNGLKDLGLPKLACVTDDGNFWIYDQQNQRLIKIDHKGTPLLTGNTLNQLTDKPLNPKILLSTDTWLILRNDDSTVYIFDKFGSYFRNLYIDFNENFQASGNLILYFKDDKIFSRNVTNGNEGTLIAPELQGTLMLRMEQNRLYLKKADKLEIYSY